MVGDLVEPEGCGFDAGDGDAVGLAVFVGDGDGWSVAACGAAAGAAGGWVAEGLAVAGEGDEGEGDEGGDATSEVSQVYVVIDDGCVTDDMTSEVSSVEQTVCKMPAALEPETVPVLKRPAAFEPETVPALKRPAAATAAPTTDAMEESVTATAASPVAITGCCSATELSLST